MALELESMLEELFEQKRDAEENPVSMRCSISTALIYEALYLACKMIGKFKSWQLFT